MKKLLLFVFLFCSLGIFAQKSDTIIVPVGKYQFIKVGDKVYKLVTTLEEALPAPKTNGILYWNNGIQSDSLAYPMLPVSPLDSTQYPINRLWFAESTNPLIIAKPYEVPSYLPNDTNQ